MAGGLTERVRADIAALGALDSLKKRHFHRALARTFNRKKASWLAASLHEAPIIRHFSAGTPAVKARISEKCFARSNPQNPARTPYAPDTDPPLIGHAQQGVRGTLGL
jgi:hypothetical protein